MKTITVKIPEELYNKMKAHKEINWSEVIRRAIENKLEGLEGVTTGSELIEMLKRLGVKEEEISIEPPQGEEEFQRELRGKRSMTQTY